MLESHALLSPPLEKFNSGPGERMLRKMEKHLQEQGTDATEVSSLWTSDGDSDCESSSSNQRSKLVVHCFSCSLRHCLFLSIVMVVLLQHFLTTSDDNDGHDGMIIAACGDCHCIVGANKTCPLRKPRVSFTEQEINTWASLQVVNPYTIDCDPYADPNCPTNPPQSQELLDLGDTAVCAIHFEETFVEGGESSCDGSKYRLQTYSSIEQAQRMGGFVTHSGHCGVCSTLQDLAAYIRVSDLTTQGTWCTVKRILSAEGGRACYRRLGLTDDCAKMWSLNSWNTARNCATECLFTEAMTGSPNNGPAPKCTLNDCLQCDEVKSGPAFRQLAGRTRRRSGLLSEIARPCDQVLNITQEACPVTLPLLLTLTGK